MTKLTLSPHQQSSSWAGDVSHRYYEARAWGRGHVQTPGYKGERREAFGDFYLREHWNRIVPGV